MSYNAEATNKSSIVLEYKNYMDMATEVAEFLKETLVTQLNTNKAFIPYRDAYEYPYNAEPTASMPSEIPSMTGMSKTEKKLTYSQVLMKHKQVEDWPEVSRQITATISLMLSKKTHSKIKSVFFEEWAQVINSGQVSKMINMIHNGLTLKAPTVKQFDRILVKKQILDFTRNENESCNESSERFLELRQRGNAMGNKKMHNRELTLIYLFANKKFYNSKPVMQIEIYLDDMITKAENDTKSPKLLDVMKGLREIEARVTQYTTDINSNKKIVDDTKGEDSNVVMVNEQVQNTNGKRLTAKDKPYKSTRDYKNTKPRKENVHTAIHAAKLVIENKYPTIPEAVRNITCTKCKGKYHVAEDCRKQMTGIEFPKRRSNYTKDPPDKQAYCMEINNELQQAMNTIERFNADSTRFMETEYTVMTTSIDMDDTSPGLKGYFKNRYNYDNHANINVFNNRELVTNIRPTNEKVAGYGAITQLKWECQHPIFGEGFFDENSKYNLLGMTAINKMGFTEYKPREAMNNYTILCHPKYGDITLEINEMCPFYSIHHTDLMQQIHQNNVKNHAYPMQTIREYTDEQYRKAEDILVLHKRLGHPAAEKIKAILDNNLLVNTILTSQDLKRAQDIFGRCEICDVVKPIKVTNQYKTYEPKVATIGETMHIDIIFMSAKDAYLLTVESLTNYLAVYKVIDKKNILEQIKWMIANAKLYDHNIRLIRPDSENVLISNELRQYLALNHQIKVDAAIPLEHEKTAESNVARVRTRMRCISYELYYRLPALFVGYLLMYVVDVLNMTPNAKIKHNSPAQLYEGRKPNYLTDLTISFGAACIVSNTDDLDKLHATHAVGIALGRSKTNTGGVYIWIPGKNIKVRRVIGHTKLTRDMIEAIHTLTPAMGDFVKPGDKPKTKTTTKNTNNDNLTLKGAVETNTNYSKYQVETPHNHNTSSDNSIINKEAAINFINDNQNKIGVDNVQTNHNIDNHYDGDITISNNHITNEADITNISNNHIINEADITHDHTTSFDNHNINNMAKHNHKRKRDYDNIDSNTMSQESNNNANKQPETELDTQQSKQINNPVTHTYNTRSSKVAQIYTVISTNIHQLATDELEQATTNALRTAADYQEIKQILEFKTCKFLKHISHRDPSINSRILPAHFVRTVKYNKGVYMKHKSRLTAGGNFELGLQEAETSSPTVSYETIMIQLAVAVTKNHRISSIDYQAAFLNAPTPYGKKHVIRLNKYETKLACAIDPSLAEYIQDDGTLLAQLEKSYFITSYVFIPVFRQSDLNKMIFYIPC